MPSSVIRNRGKKPARKDRPNHGCFDRRWQEAELFPRVLQCAIGAEPFPYHQFTAERTG